MAHSVGLTPFPAAEVTASVTQTVDGSPVALASGTVTPGAAPGHADAEFVVQRPRPGHVVPRHTVTIGSLSNIRMFNGQALRCMEPITYRTKMSAIADSPDGTTLEFDRGLFTQYDRVGEGAFDGGTVRIQRVVNGVLTDIRSETIAPGGHRASAWQRIHRGEQIVPADATSYRIALPKSYRRDATLYVAVAALNARGEACTPAVIALPTPPAAATWTSQVQVPVTYAFSAAADPGFNRETTYYDPATGWSAKTVKTSPWYTWDAQTQTGTVTFWRDSMSGNRLPAIGASLSRNLSGTDLTGATVAGPLPAKTLDRAPIVEKFVAGTAGLIVGAAVDNGRSPPTEATVLAVEVTNGDPALGTAEGFLLLRPDGIETGKTWSAGNTIYVSGIAVGTITKDPVTATEGVDGEVLEEPAETGEIDQSGHVLTFSPAFAAPADLAVTAGSTLDDLTLSWAAVPGCHGYIVLRSDHDPARPEGLRGYGLTLPPGTALLKGDICFIEKKIYQPSGLRATARYGGQGEWPLVLTKVPTLFDAAGDQIIYDNKPASGSFGYVPFSPGDPSPHPDCNTAFARVVTLANLPLEFRWSQFSLNGAGGREVLKPGYRYRMAAWVRVASGTQRLWMRPLISDGTAQAILDAAVAGSVDPGVRDNADPGEPLGEFIAGTDWREIIVDFWVPADTVWPGNNTLGGLTLRLVEAGEYHIGTFRCWELGPSASATGPVTGGEDAYGDLTRLEKEKIEASAFSVLRYHGGVKAFQDCYDVGGLTNAPGGCNGGVYQHGETFIQQVRMAQLTGKGVWFQPPFHFSRAEWQAFMRYVAEPYDPLVDSEATKPWAHKRHSQGYTAPLTDLFPEIWWEFSNETWNNAFYPWTVPGTHVDAVTGLKQSTGQMLGHFLNYMIDSFEALDFWDDVKGKFRFVIGGHSKNPNFAGDAARIAPRTHVAAVANYIGGWDESGVKPREWRRDAAGAILTGTPDHASYDAMLVSAERVVRARADRLIGVRDSVNSERAILHPTAPRLIVGTYEAGPGYVISGLGGQTMTSAEYREQLRVKTSLSSAVSAIDVFMLTSQMGYEAQNFFAFNSNDIFGAFAPDIPGSAHQYGQFFLQAKLFNAVNTTMLPGRSLPVHAAKVPRRDLPANGKLAAFPGFRRVAVYATRPGDDPTKLAVMVINRDLRGYPDEASAGTLDIRLRVPVLSCASLKVYRFPVDTAFNAQNGLDAFYSDGGATGAPFRDVDVVTEILPIPSDPRVLTITGMPPASAAIYLWEGVL